MPFGEGAVQRSSAYVADDHDGFRARLTRSRNGHLAKRSGQVGPFEMSLCWRNLAGLITFFDKASPSIVLRSEMREFFRTWRARQDSNLRPSATKTRQRGRAVCVHERRVQSHPAAETAATARMTRERCLDRLPSPAPVTVRRGRRSSEESGARSRPAPTPRAPGRRAG